MEGKEDKGIHRNTIPLKVLGLSTGMTQAITPPHMYKHMLSYNPPSLAKGPQERGSCEFMSTSYIICVFL